VPRCIGASPPTVAERGKVSDSSCYHLAVKQIITRVDDELAEALKKSAAESGQTINGYVTKVLRTAVSVPAGRSWKTAAIARGLLVSRVLPVSSSPLAMSHGAPDMTPVVPPGFVRTLVSNERDER